MEPERIDVVKQNTTKPRPYVAKWTRRRVVRLAKNADCPLGIEFSNIGTSAKSATAIANMFALAPIAVVTKTSLISMYDYLYSALRLTIIVRVEHFSDLLVTLPQFTDCCVCQYRVSIAGNLPENFLNALTWDFRAPWITQYSSSR